MLPQQSEAIYFDGQSNRKHKVSFRFGSALEILHDGAVAALWPYGEVRRVPSAPGPLRLMCASAPGRIEIFDEPTRQAVEARCPSLGGIDGPRHTWKILAYSGAALASFVGLLVYGIPLLADRLAPVVPHAVERRLGEAVDPQFRRMIGGKICDNASGDAALAGLVDRLQTAGGAAIPPDVKVVATSLPNAFALPGGKIYVTDGLLQRARNPDELAGVIAHELGHLHGRDGLRKLIQDGGTGFLMGFLFGDVVGAGAVLFVARSLLTLSYSRDAERNADKFSADLMLSLGRSPKAMGDLLLRITGSQPDGVGTIGSSHPLTDERRKVLTEAERPATGDELLTSNEWNALRQICR